MSNLDIYIEKTCTLSQACADNGELSVEKKSELLLFAKGMALTVKPAMLEVETYNDDNFDDAALKIGHAILKTLRKS